jgi:hypothetical protein
MEQLESIDSSWEKIYQWNISESIDWVLGKSINGPSGINWLGFEKIYQWNIWNQ